MNTQKNDGNHRDYQKPLARRRLLHFGPGIAIALVLAAVIGGNAIKKDVRLRQAPSAPPIIERNLIIGGLEESGPTPEIGFLLARRGRLELSDEQTVRLHELQLEWKSYYEPKLAEANEAAQQLQDGLARAGKRGSTPASQIQSQAGPMIAVSGEISEKRREYWDRATRLLSSEQRDAVLAERKAEQATRQKAMKDAVGDAADK